MILQPFDIFLFSIYFILLFLSIFWITVFFTRPDEKKPQPRKELPFFTAIVPAYNEEKSILQTLASLIALDYPKEKKQIIIVNDGSKDTTCSLVESFISSHPQDHIELINQENKGKGAALNNGLARATGEFFACLDADSFIEPNALKEMLPYFERHDVAAVCPLLKVHQPKKFIELIQSYEYIVNMFYKYLNGKLDCVHVTPGPFSMYRTKTVRDLGGYDENNITEDLELAIRLQKYNYKIIQTYDAMVHTNTPKTWKKLFWQRVRWYKGSVENSFKYKHLFFNTKYGDFGFIRMPTIAFPGLLSIIILGVLAYRFGEHALKSFLWLFNIDFNLIPYAQTLHIPVDSFSVPYAKYFIAFISFAVAIFVTVYAYRIIGERILKHGKAFVSILLYFFLYSVFLSTVWLYVAVQTLTKGKTRW